jgi:hypothetical protein
MHGSGNPSWEGGISKEPYSFNFNKKLKDAVKQRDNHQCQNPDCWKNEFKNALIVHHVEYDKKNCDPFSLITLCRSCNARANFNKAFWQNFYACLMASKQLSTASNL